MSWGEQAIIAELRKALTKIALGGIDIEEAIRIAREALK